MDTRGGSVTEAIAGKPDPSSVFMCLICQEPVEYRDIVSGKSSCARSGHIMGEYARKKSLSGDIQTLMKRAREKWHEFRKDKSKDIGVGF